MHFQKPRSLLLPMCSANRHKDECFSGLALPHSCLSPLPTPGGAGSHRLHQAVQAAPPPPREAVEPDFDSRKQSEGSNGSR